MSLPRDLRFALRFLAKSPGFLLVATACLGLALALNTTTFAILDAMLHPSLPVRDADRLFSISMWGRQAANDVPLWERYEVLRAAKFYEDIAVADFDRGATVGAGGELYDTGVLRVSSNFYSLLGANAESGRLLSASTPEDAAVVSHEFWERSLGGRSLEGLTVWVNERQYRVVGVLPSAPAFLFWDVAVPLTRTAERTGAGIHRVIPIVRVPKGMTREALVTRLAGLARTVSPAYAFVPNAVAPYPRELRQIHFAMAGAALLVLLIACGNLAGLMLVRGATRRREVALRLALGAGRRAVVRQLLTEAALIAAAGMAAGLLLTLWAIPILGNRMPPSVETLGLVTPHASWRVFAFGALVALGTIVAIGLWPALRASDVDVSEPLKDGSAITRRARWRYQPVVVAEIALSLVLLMGVSLLTRAAGSLTESMLGYDRQGLLRAWVWVGAAGIGPDSARALSRRLLARLAALPDVRSAAAVEPWGERSVWSEFYDGSNGILSGASVIRVSDGFLRTLGVPVLQGRDFVPGDEQSGAVIVDQAAATALWPDGHAVGRLVEIGDPALGHRWLPVVGMARHALVWGPPVDPDLKPDGVVYQAWQPGAFTLARAVGWQLAVRTPGLSRQAAVSLRQVIRDVLPGAQVLYVQPWLARWDTEVRARYFLIGIFATFSAFALALAAVGLYGVVSYSVSQRMREFAVRVAVGAARPDMVRLVAHDAIVMTLAGVGLGAFLAMWGSTLLGDWLFDVYHTDARSLLVAELVLFGAAILACLQPVLRATHADPVQILRAI